MCVCIHNFVLWSTIVTSLALFKQRDKSLQMNSASPTQKLSESLSRFAIDKEYDALYSYFDFKKDICCRDSRWCIAGKSSYRSPSGGTWKYFSEALSVAYKQKVNTCILRAKSARKLWNEQLHSQSKLIRLIFILESLHYWNEKYCIKDFKGSKINPF